jgi:hypothetical protein
MSGPYLKFLRAQWIQFSRANPLLFTFKRELQTGLEFDRALRNYRGRVIESASAYGLWRSVLDFEGHWLTEGDRIEAGRFLTKEKLDPRRFALDEAEGLAQALKRFAVPPLHEWALDVVRLLDERLCGDFEQERAFDMIIGAFAALNCGPTRVQMLMDEWYSRDLVTAEEHRSVAEFFANAGFPPPDYVRIGINVDRGIVVSETAEGTSIAPRVKRLKAARKAAGKREDKREE